MNALNRAMTAYGQANSTLAPLHQIVLLYDGAIRRIKEARAAIDRRKIAERHTAVAKAAAIVEGLQGCLDHEQGGEIAGNLDRLYTYVIFRLHRINMTDDVAICDELIARLSELRESWAQVAGSSAEPVPTPPPAAPAGRSVTI